MDQVVLINLYFAETAEKGGEDLDERGPESFIVCANLSEGATEKEERAGPDELWLAAFLIKG